MKKKKNIQITNYIRRIKISVTDILLYTYNMYYVWYYNIVQHITTYFIVEMFLKQTRIHRVYRKILIILEETKVYNKYSLLRRFIKKHINKCNDIVLMCCSRVSLIVVLNIYNHGYLDNCGYITSRDMYRIIRLMLPRIFYSV